jgi:hypothetical protein
LLLLTPSVAARPLRSDLEGNFLWVFSLVEHN